MEEWWPSVNWSIVARIVRGGVGLISWRVRARMGGGEAVIWTKRWQPLGFSNTAAGPQPRPLGAGL